MHLHHPELEINTLRPAFEAIPNLKLYRICNHRDVVTAVPNWGYYHVGHNLYCDGKKEWVDYGFAPKVSYMLYRCWNPFDHFCNKYVDNLKKMIDN